MCALDLKPLSLVEGNGFKHFVHALNPQYRVPCRKTVSKYLDVIYEEEKSKLIENIGGQSVSVTSDLWMSNAMQAYITVIQRLKYCDGGGVYPERGQCGQCYISGDLQGEQYGHSSKRA